MLSCLLHASHPSDSRLCSGGRSDEQLCPWAAALLSQRFETAASGLAMDCKE